MLPMQGEPTLRVTLLCLLLPTTEPKRDRLTGVAQPVRVSTIVHGAGYDHPAHAERRDRLSRSLRVATTVPHIALQKLTMAANTPSNARLAALPARATSLGRATIGHESLKFSKCWRDR